MRYVEWVPHLSANISTKAEKRLPVQFSVTKVGLIYNMGYIERTIINQDGGVNSVCSPNF